MSPPVGETPTTPPKRRWLRWVLLGAAAFVVLLALAIAFLPAWLSTDTGRAFWTGWIDRRARGTFRVESGDLSWADGVRLRKVVLTNPPGYGGGTMLSAERAFLDLGLGDLIAGDYDLVLELRQADLTVVRNEEGKLNVLEWWPRKAAERRSRRSPGEEGDKEERPGILLDIEVSEGRIVYEDRRLGARTVLEEVHIECGTADPRAPIRWKADSRLVGQGSGAITMTGELVLPETRWRDPSRTTGTLELQLLELESENWLPNATEEAALQALAATLAGSLRLVWGDGLLSPELDLKVTDLAARGAKLPAPFEQREATLAFQGEVPLDGKPLSWEKLALTSDWLGVESSGRVSEWRGEAPDLRSSWSLRYDLSALSPAWQRKLQNWGVEGAPAGEADFEASYGGPNRGTPPIGLEGRWTLGDLELFGNRLRDVLIDLGASEGRVRIEPRGQLNGGTFQATASIAPDSEEVELGAELAKVSVERGLTSALQYAVPFLAGTEEVARASGSLQGRLDLKGRGFEWSRLRQTLTGEGSLAVAALQVQGSALLGEIGRSLDLGDLGSLTNLTTDFTIRDGRLHNEDLRVNGQKASFYLEGSTGFDGSIDYSVSTEVLAELLRDRGGDVGKILSGVKGLTEIPLAVGGTLHRPTVEVKLARLADSLGKTLEEALGEAIGRAADEAIGKATGDRREGEKEGAREAIEDILRGREGDTSEKTKDDASGGLIGSVADQLERRKYEQQRRRAREKAEAVLKVYLNEDGRLRRQRLQGDPAAQAVLHELLRLPLAPSGATVDDQAPEIVALRVDKYNVALALVAATGKLAAPTFQNASGEVMDFGPEGQVSLGDYRARIPTDRDARLVFALAFSGDYPLPSDALLTGENLVAGAVSAGQRLLVRTTRLTGDRLEVFWYVFATAETLVGADPNRETEAFHRGVLQLLRDYLPADHPARQALQRPSELEVARTNEY